MGEGNDEQCINWLVTGRYWSDIKQAFDDMADTLTHQIYYNGNYYQCKMDGIFCSGAKFVIAGN